MKKKILWISARSIQDTTTQDTICAKAMLKALTFYEDIDIACASTFAFLDESALETVSANNIQEHKQDNITIINDETKIQYFYKKCSTTLYKDLIQNDYRVLNLFIANLYRTFKPDLVIGFGQDDFFLGANFAEAQLRGVPTAYFLPNTKHHDVAFSLSDVVFSPYESVCKHYQQQNNIEVKCCDVIFDKESVLVDERNKDYIVFIDYNDDKALRDFFALAIKAYENNLNQQFLLVVQNKDYNIYFKDYNQQHNTNYHLNDLTNINRAIRNCSLKAIIASSKIYLALNSQSIEEVEQCLSFLVNDVPCIAIEQNKFKDCEDEGFIIVNRNNDNYLDQIYENILSLNTKINSKQNISFSKCQNFISSFNLTKSASKILTIIDPLLNKYASLNSQYYRHGSFFR